MEESTGQYRVFTTLPRGLQTTSVPNTFAPCRCKTSLSGIEYIIQAYAYGRRTFSTCLVWLYELLHDVHAIPCSPPSRLEESACHQLTGHRPIQRGRLTQAAQLSIHIRAQPQPQPTSKHHQTPRRAAERLHLLHPSLVAVGALLDALVQRMQALHRRNDNLVQGADRRLVEQRFERRLGRSDGCWVGVEGKDAGGFECLPSATT